MDCLRRFLVLLVGISFVLPVYAQTFPNKPVRLVVAFTPGSSTDIIGRVVAAKLSEMWGQTVVAENRAGAGGSIGSKYVVDQAPDGYTLLANSSAHAANPGIYAKIGRASCRERVYILLAAGWTKQKGVEFSYYAPT